MLVDYAPSENGMSEHWWLATTKIFPDDNLRIQLVQYCTVHYQYWTERCFGCPREEIESDPEVV